MIHETSVVKKVHFPSTSMVDAKKKQLYDPQSAGINVQSRQSESTPRRLTLAPSKNLDLKARPNFLIVSVLFILHVNPTL